MSRMHYWLAASSILLSCLLVIACGKISAQETTKPQLGTLFERFQAMEVSAPPADSQMIEVTGLVRNPDYTIARAIVLCLRIEGEVATVLAKATTNESGRYSMELTPPIKKHEKYEFFAVDTNNQMAWSIEHIQPELNRSISFLLAESTGRIEGTLIAPGNQPVAGIEVTIFGWLQTRQAISVDFKPFEFRAISDENGHFAIESLPTQIRAIVTIKSDHWGCVGALIPTSADTPDDPHLVSATFLEYMASRARLKLYPKCDITGSIIDSKGNPVAGVKVDDCKELTNDRGEFSIRRIDLNAWGPDAPKDYFDGMELSPPEESRFLPTYVALTRKNLTSRNLQPIVLEGEYVSGRVIAASTKKPLPSIRVRSLDHSQEVLSDADGRFRLPALPGQKEILFTPEWMSNTEQQQFLLTSNSRSKRYVDLLDGEPVDMGTVLLDVDPSEVKPLTIKAIAKGRIPVANCRIELTKQDEPLRPSYQASLVDGDAIVQHILTDRVGRAVVVPAGGWAQLERHQPVAPNEVDVQPANIVTATYHGKMAHYYGSMNVSKVTDELVELRLSEGAQIHGKVLLNGFPLEGVRITARVNGLHPESVSSLETNENGEYTIYAPAAKSYELNSLSGLPVANYSIGVRQFEVQSTDNPLLFTVPPIELVASTGKIRGIVVDQSRQPASGR